MKKQKIWFSTTHIILLSFLSAIFIGAVLLCLPISSANGEATPFIDALFTATTATCVTGLVVTPTVVHWSVFGQVVILALIQVGGLGIITVMSGLALILHRRMGISSSVLLQDAFNLNTLSKIGLFVQKVILGTFLIEGIGALLYMTVFVPQFGPKGIWISIFTAISAFCNAGIDIIATDSLCGYVNNTAVNLITMSLIILGGIGYIVWWDVIRVIRERKTKKSCWKYLTLHSKIAISTTAVLILSGAVLVFIFEFNNPETIGNMSLFHKIQASFFQSVTTRTAGFATIPQENLTNSSSLVSMILMFIGGSPVGTAGGIKTVTFAVLAATAYATVRNCNEVSFFGRTITKSSLNKAVSVVLVSFLILFTSVVLLAFVSDAPLIDVLYEATSAVGTVGLTRDFTGSLNALGKIIIMATMYLGRVGPISFAIVFALKKVNRNIIKNPTEEISIG
ncbi:MAG: potassium transporter TrkG [Acutalibacteraceae bacterium]|nr:potassium transporter TrkG [Acutalibacteraceae bacterium]